MKFNELTINGGSFNSLVVPSPTENARPGQIAVSGTTLQLFNGETFTSVTELLGRDSELAGSILDKLKHWWPLDSMYDGKYVMDVHGGMDMKAFDGDGATIGATLNPQGANSMGFIADTAGLFVHGNPAWMINKGDIAATAWVKTEQSNPKTSRTIFFSAPQGDHLEAANLTSLWRLTPNDLPSKAIVTWEYGLGTDVIVHDPEDRFTHGDPQFIGFNVDRTQKTVQHMHNGTASAALTYDYEPTGGNSNYVKLAVGNIAYTLSAGQEDANETRSNSQPFSGYIQDLALYSKPLTPEESAWLYNRGNGRTYDQIVSASQRDYLWTPARLKNKVLWVKADSDENTVSGSGVVTRVANHAGFMPGVPYNGASNHAFLNNLTTLNGRKVLTGRPNTTAWGHFIFPNTHLKRFLGVDGCSIFAVTKPSTTVNLFTVEVSVCMPGTSHYGQLLGLERNNTGYPLGTISTGGRRNSSNTQFMRGPIKSPPNPGWAISCAWNDYTNGTNNLRVDGGSTLSSTLYSTGLTDTVNAHYPIAIGGNAYNTASRGGTEFAEVIVIDARASLADIQRVEGYLAHSWGLTGLLPSSHPYKTTPPKVS